VKGFFAFALLLSDENSPMLDFGLCCGLCNVCSFSFSNFPVLVEYAG